MSTRKIYELPAPTTAHHTSSDWYTDHSIEIDGEFYNDGCVRNNHDRNTVEVETYDSQVLALGYDEAERVALAILAAVEESKANS